MENKLKTRHDSFKDNSSAQRHYFLERVKVEALKEDNHMGVKVNPIGSPIRNEFLNRVNLMQEDKEPFSAQSSSNLLSTKNICRDLSGKLPKQKGYTRQVDADGNLVLNKDGERHNMVANYVPKLLQIMVDEDGNTILRLNVIPAQTLPISQREPFVIDIPEGVSISEEIQKKRKSLSLECNFSRARTNLDAFVMDQAAHFQEELVYTKPGIVKTEYGYDFVDKNGSVRGFELSVNMQQELGYNYHWPEKYVAEAIVNLLRMSNKLEKILPILLFSVLARISDLFRIANCPPKFHQQLCGRTGSLKTSVALAVFTPYKNVDGDLPPGTFEDTAAALEIEACRHGGSVYLVDDVHPPNTATDKQRIYKSHGGLVRMFGDGGTFAKANGMMQRQKTFKASGLCAFTAEYPIGSESDRARGLNIEVDQETYKRDVLSFYQQNPTIIPTFLAYFLRYVLPKADQLIEFISRRFIEERIAYLGRFEHGRQTECYACLKIVADLLLQYLVSQGLIKDVDETQKIWTEAIYKAVEAGQTEIKDHNPVAVFIKMLQMMVATNRIPFIPYESRLEDSEKMVAGFFDDNYYYLHFDMVFKLISKEASNYGTPINMNKNQLIAGLADEGLIETFTENRNGKSSEVRTKKISVSKAERAQMVLLMRNVLNQKLEVLING